MKHTQNTQTQEEEEKKHKMENRARSPALVTIFDSKINGFSSDRCCRRRFEFRTG